MERKIYELLFEHQIPRGPWLGGQVELSIQDGTHLAEASIETLLSPPERIVFRRTPHGGNGGFLERRRAEYEEVGAEGQPLGRAILEYVAPGPGLGFNSQCSSGASDSASFPKWWPLRVLGCTPTFLTFRRYRREAD